MDKVAEVVRIEIMVKLSIVRWSEINSRCRSNHNGRKYGSDKTDD